MQLQRLLRKKIKNNFVYKKIFNKITKFNK